MISTARKTHVRLVLYIGQLRSAKIRAKHTVPLLAAVTLHELTIVALITPLTDVVLISVQVALFANALTTAPFGEGCVCDSSEFFLADEALGA